ncbi:MAG: hypothetical protein QXK51_08600 [Candidatus Methanomethylicia archaeon]
MSIIEILRILIGFILINVLPGFLVSCKVFQEGSITLRLTSSVIVSMIITSIPPMILTFYLGLRWPLSLYVTLIIALIFNVYLLLKSNYTKPKISVKYIIPSILIGLATVRYFLPYIMLNQSMPFGFDPAFHCRDIKNIINNRGIASGLYPQAFHFMVAANVVMMNLSIPTTFMLVSILIVDIIALEVYILTEKILNSYAGFLSYISILLLTVHPFHSLTDGLIPELFAVSVLILGIVKLIDLIRDKSLKSMIYSGVIIGSSLYIHITPLAILFFIPFLMFALLIRLLKYIRTLKFHGRNLKLIIGVEVTSSVKLALRVFTVIPIALLASSPSSALYIANIILDLMGKESSLPTGELTKPVFPHDFEMVFGREFLYLGLVSLIILPLISRRIEYIVIYSIIISQLVIIWFSLVQIPFRFLRIVPIFLSVVIGLFIYFMLKTPRRILLNHRFLRTALKMFSMLIIILILVFSTPKVLESSVQIAKSNIWYFHEDISSYMFFNNLPEGVILTDFSCGWLPYFTENKLLIIPPYGSWSFYGIRDQKIFMELISASGLKPIDAYNTLSKYNISYIYLGIDPQKRHFVPSGYMEVRMNIEKLAETLQNSSLIEQLYLERIGNDMIKIYGVRLRS